VSRGLRSKEFAEKLDLQIAEASDDLLKQAAHLFLQLENKDQDSVLAIAAAGKLIHLHICVTYHDAYPQARSGATRQLIAVTSRTLCTVSH
jgi:hypothetical protein